MDPLGGSTTTINHGDILMSNYDKISLRLLGILLVTGAVLLVLLWKWSREFCGRTIGFGSKIFSAQRKTKKSWKKFN